jgi:glucose/mannose-6-phosphate isomerase
LIPGPADELNGALVALREQRATLGAGSPIMQNEAKRLAGQCVGRWVTVFGSDHLEPVARYWKIQLNELAKTWSHSEAIPEADHNALLGVVNPAQMMGQTMLLFLRSRGCHPRNQRRTKITKEYFMLEGLGTDFFNARGDTRLAQMLTALHFGDYLAYYLAMAYDTDPNPLETIEAFKQYLAESG